MFVDNVFQSQWEKFSKEKEFFMEEIEKYHTAKFEDYVEEFVRIFFDEWKHEDIDFDYLFKVVPTALQLESELQQQVNEYVQTFTYEDMDTLDKALFLLGYWEWKALATPKEVIINELIEIAKRYCDEGAPKLLNWIMHKIITK